jgi:cytochrome c-type biogenesis protein CcmF
MTYIGQELIEDGKALFVVEVQKEGETHLVKPLMYFSEFTRGTMRNPDLINFLSNDLYVAPLSLEESGDQGETTVELVQGKEVDLESFNLTFEEFGFSAEAREAMMEGKPFVINASVSVREKQQKKGTRVSLSMKGTGTSAPEFIPIEYRLSSGQTIGLQLVSMQPASEGGPSSKIAVAVHLPHSSEEQKPETLIVEASVKPMINLVWAGTVTLIVGFLLTIFRRVQESGSRD